MNMVLNQSNLVLVNRMRIAAQRESSELDILRFFADLDYARSRLLAFVATGKPELAALARRTASTVLASDAPARAPAAAAAAAEPAAALAAVAPAVHQASTAPAQHHLPTAPALHPGLVAPAVGATTPRRTAPAVAPAATPASAAAPGRQFTEAKELMNRLAVEVAGIRATFFVLKLEKCMSRDDLLALLPAFHQVMVRGTGGTIAATMMAQVKGLLGNR